MVWTVAHNNLTDVVKQQHNINVTTTSNKSGNCWSSNLTIHALPINNKIEIACIVHSFHPNSAPNYTVAAKEVKLTVKGY